MNDEFIYRALPTVRKEFAQSLYRKISASTPAFPHRGIHSQKLQVAVILLGVLILVAWSQVHLWIRYVPIGDLWLIEFNPTQPRDGPQTMEPIPTPDQLPTAILNDGIKSIIVRSWDLLRHLSPDWIPDGFTAAKIPTSSYSYEESIGMWSNDAQETIRLFVVPRAGGARPYAPAGMYKEVRVNGQPAILVYGRFAPNSPEDPQAQRKWDETLGFQLTWSLEDSIYTLETLGSYVTEQDLIRMAESMEVIAQP